MFPYYLVEEEIYPVTIAMLYYKIKGDTTTSASPMGICLSFSFAFVAFASKHNVVNENKLILSKQKWNFFLATCPPASSQN